MKNLRCFVTTATLAMSLVLSNNSYATNAHSDLRASSNPLRQVVQQTDTFIKSASYVISTGGVGAALYSMAVKQSLGPCLMGLAVSIGSYKFPELVKGGLGAEI